MPHTISNVIKFRPRATDVILDSLPEQEDKDVPDFFFEFMEAYEQVGLEFYKEDEVA